MAAEPEAGQAMAARDEARAVAPSAARFPHTSLRRDSALRRLLALADMLAILAALAAARAFFSEGLATATDVAWGLPTLTGWIVLFKAYGLYDRDSKRVSHSSVDDLPWIFHALVVGSVGLWFYYRILPAHQLILREGTAFFAFALVGVFVARAAARAVARAAIPPERVLFLGGGPSTTLLIEKVQAHPEYGLQPVGYADANPPQASDPDARIPFLGALDEVGEICHRERIDRVIVAAPAVDETALTDLLRGMERQAVRISILPQMVDVLGPSVEIDDVEGITVLGINPPALTPSSRFLKRLMDVSIALPALVLALPLFGIIAVAIKVTSRGPIFFSQPRMGRRGRQFRMHKFRTMVADAEGQIDELRSLSAHPAWLLLDRDPRVTPVGRFLRHLSLDELPQLWNVLRGEMSLVGPRPMPLDVDEKIAGWGRRRLDLTPGITGLWQVLGRASIPFEEMVKLDYLYVTNWSLWQDVRLLIRTLPAVIRRRGVN
jgi:exopolysaccharide biosynthesis polyprenyl glycosylphosphotransferase